MEVHSQLGPGLLESAYRICLVHELSQRGRAVRSEINLPVSYKGMQLDAGYRLDLLVEDTVIVELKACESLNAVHEAQLLSYLRLHKKRVGLLINFHVRSLKDGVRRFIND